MKTFALESGDLVVSNGSYMTVSGAQRMQQQIGLSLMEPTGIDRFHPQWGSILDQLIGTSMTPDITERVKTEVYRVIKNIAALQNSAIQRSATVGSKPQVTPDELITGVTGVSVEQVRDAINVKISLSTAGRETVTVNTSIDGGI